MPGSTQQVYLTPTLWDGSAQDVTPFGYIDIWCIIAPTTPYTINTGPLSSTMFPQLAEFMTGSSITYSSIISAVGRYRIAAHCFMELTGGAGGEFYYGGGSQ